MADITVTIQDGMGLGDNSENGSQAKKPVNDYVNADETLELNSAFGKSIDDPVDAIESSKLNDGFNEINDSVNTTDASDNEDTTIRFNEDLILNDNVQQLPSDVPSYEDEIIIVEVDSAIVSQSTVDGGDTQIAIGGEANPDVVIVMNSPVDLSEYLHKSIINFNATVTKSGIPILDSSLKWSSSIDGVFKIGNNFNYNGLSVGGHTIRLYIDGEWYGKKISLTIRQTNKSDRPENLTEV